MKQQPSRDTHTGGPTDATTVLPGATSVGAAPTRPRRWGAPQSASQRSAGPHPAAETAEPVEPAYAETESVVFGVRRHGRHLVFPVLAMLLITGVSAFYIGALPESWMNIAAAVGAALLFTFLGLAPLFSWLSRRAVVTTRRVILRHGVFVRHRTEVTLARVREVRTRQTIAQRMCGAGDLVLAVGPDSTTIADAPGIRTLHSAVQELVERQYDEHAATGWPAAMPSGPSDFAGS